MTDHKEQYKKETSQHEDAAVQPDPETLHTPDPQDEMKGPISSLVQGVKEGLENNKNKKEADKIRNEKK